jgi:ATP-dependent DNA helicase RecQ
VIAERQEHARTKLDLMLRYCSTHQCRRQMILDYFGDETQVADCQCDACRALTGTERSRPAMDAQSAVMSDEATLLVRQLLSAIARCRGKFGVGVVAEMLAGSESERTLKWGLNELSTFGILRAYPVKRVIAMLHRLLESGLARQRDPDGVKFRPVIDLTSAGVAVMKAEQLPPAGLADLLPRRKVAVEVSRRRAAAEFDESDITPDATDRFERLRALRARIARERSLPAYVICHDATLKQLAVQAPADISGLESIRGMGPYKIKMYGQAFLEAMHAS